MEYAGNDAAVDGVLAHYGVRGMKWGVRRSAKQLARAAASRESESEDYATAKAAASKPVSALSNQEMQTLITRLNLEQQYAKLNPKHESLLTRGRKEATSILADVGREQVKRVARAAVTSKVDKVAATKGLDVQTQINKLKKK